MAYVTSGSPDINEAIASYEPTREIVVLFHVDAYEDISEAIKTGRSSLAAHGRYFFLTASQAPAPPAAHS